MPFTVDEILTAAMHLSEAERLVIASHLLESLPETMPGLSVDDPGFLEEIERRATDSQPLIAAAEIWEHK